MYDQPSAVQLIAASGHLPSSLHLPLTRDKVLAPHLAINPALSGPAIDALLSAKPKLVEEVASRLVARALTEEQLDTLLARETRVKVLIAASGYNRFGTRRITELLEADRLTPKLLESLEMFEKESFTPALTARVRRAVGGVPWLTALAHSSPTELSNDDLAAELSSIEEWGPRQARAVRSSLILRIATERPGMIKHFTAPGVAPMLSSAVAGSRLLTDPAAQRVVAALDPLKDEFLRPLRPKHEFALMALVANPVVALDSVRAVRTAVLALEPAERADYVDLLSNIQSRLDKALEVVVPYDQITHADQLRKVLWRALPSDWSAGRIWDAPALLTNPNLAARDRARLVEMFEYAEPFPTWGLSAQLLERAKPLCAPDQHALLERMVSDAPEAEGPTQAHYAPDQVGSVSEFALEDALGKTPHTQAGYGYWGNTDALVANLALALNDEAGEPSFAAWSVALGMIPDFEGTLAELISVVRSVLA